MLANDLNLATFQTNTKEYAMNKYSVTFDVRQYRNGREIQELYRLVLEAKKLDDATMTKWEQYMKSSFPWGEGVGPATVTIVFVIKLD
jgi:hypothetical protein